MTNTPNFYVYCREYYPVYEPAEGGYYVRASKITYCEKFFFLEDAYEDLLESIMNLVEEGHEIHDGSWECGFKTMNGETWLKFPYFFFDYTGYIGDGFKIGITTEEPEDNPYMGYC